MQSEEPCEPCELDLDTEWRELDALTVVDTVRADQVAEKASSSNNARVKDRVICTLWCGSSHPAGDHRQPMVKCNQSTVPTIEHAVRALRLKIQEKHADCIAVAEAARAAAGGPHTRPASDALAALMAARKAQQAASRAEAAVKAATNLRDAARAACEAAERELAALTAAAVQADAELPAAKRQRNQGPLLPWQKATAGWTLDDWSKWEAGEQTRRAVATSLRASSRSVTGSLSKRASAGRLRRRSTTAQVAPLSKLGPLIIYDS